MKCQKCQNEVFLPFRCPYCGNYFCSEHRLPENHQCTQIRLALTQKQQTQPTAPQKQKQYEYTITYAQPKLTKTKTRFSGKEIQHLTIAAILVIGIGLSWGTFLNTNTQISDPSTLAAFTVILTASFFAHEIAHKVAAQRRGLWAEFRITAMGAILTLFSVFSPIFKIISPGAVVVAGPADKESMGRISIIGPATNITLSTIVLIAALLLPQYTQVLLLGAAVNAWIALFNLIPFGILDGFKVFLWNKKNWTLAFTASLTLTMISYIFIFLKTM